MLPVKIVPNINNNLTIEISIPVKLAMPQQTPNNDLFLHLNNLLDIIYTPNNFNTHKYKKCYKL